MVEVEIRNLNFMATKIRAVLRGPNSADTSYILSGNIVRLQNKRISYKGLSIEDFRSQGVEVVYCGQERGY